MQQLRGLLIVLLVLSSTASCTVPADTAHKVIYLVRHAEKCERQGSNPDLTAAGRDRARTLADMLADANIDRIYSTPYNRTRQTARPVADDHGTQITDVSPRSQFNGELARELLSGDFKAALVVGHSNTIPPLANALAGTDFPSYSEAVYDRFYTVTITEDGKVDGTVERYGEEYGQPADC